MTGYGQGSAESPGIRVTVAMRSVNNRFADLKLRLPETLAALEPDLRRAVLARVRRGRVDIDLRVERTGGDAAPITLNRPAAEAVLGAWKTLREEYGVGGEADLAALVRVPGVLDLKESVAALDDAGREAARRALEQALAGLEAARAREGALLAADLLERIARLASIVEEVHCRAAVVPAAVRAKLAERIEAIAPGVSIEPARLAQEVAFLADRADVTEEIVRLTGHIAQARTFLAEPDGEPVGKRLDFLLQEINRETNTIASKSADLEMSRGALALKNEAEKIREQIQNLE